jgi:hypothetical protein
MLYTYAICYIYQDWLFIVLLQNVKHACKMSHECKKSSMHAKCHMSAKSQTCMQNVEHKCKMSNMSAKCRT